MEIFHNDKDNINKKGVETKKPKMKIPKDIQEQMLEFFMQTSIPRKKAKITKDNHLPTEEAGR